MRIMGKKEKLQKLIEKVAAISYHSTDIYYKATPNSIRFRRISTAIDTKEYMENFRKNRGYNATFAGRGLVITDYKEKFYEKRNEAQCFS